MAVLDVDSAAFGSFDQVDRAQLEVIAAMVYSS
jgi:putative methionine-R-sulfoxide reductase with GAF domain